MGYTAENEQDYWSWNKKDNKQYAFAVDCNRHYFLYDGYFV